MNLEFLNNATGKEQEHFKSVCNQLLSRTYLVRTLPARKGASGQSGLYLPVHSL